MKANPYSEVVIAGAYNTAQARTLDGHTSTSIAIEAALGVAAQAGIELTEVDGIMGRYAGDVAYGLGLGPLWDSRSEGGIWAVLLAGHLVQLGVCNMVLIADGGAGVYTDPASTAPWTRPSNEFVACFGLYTAVEFALIARRHMEIYGTTPEQLAAVASTIRNNGHVNPDAVFRGRGPYTPPDILTSRMIADPFHLLDCSMTSEGGCALLITNSARATDLATRPVHILGGGVDHYGPPYQYPPVYDLGSHRDDDHLGNVGRRAAREAMQMAGVCHQDIDVCELYDPFSFEIIRQLEAFGFCEPGDGGPFVESGAIALDSALPVTTDGGTMSFSHAGGNTQMLQRVVRGVDQLCGRCTSGQIEGAEIALCSNGGAGAFFNDVLILGTEPS